MVSRMEYPVPAPDLIFRFTVVALHSSADGAGIAGAGAGAGADEDTRYAVET
jgi:hypothetical protein